MPGQLRYLPTRALGEVRTDLAYGAVSAFAKSGTDLAYGAGGMGGVPPGMEQDGGTGGTVLGKDGGIGGTVLGKDGGTDGTVWGSFSTTLTSRRR
eukprot:3576923-Rhodomonas_salina.1